MQGLELDLEKRSYQCLKCNTKTYQKAQHRGKFRGAVLLQTPHRAVLTEIGNPAVQGGVLSAALLLPTSLNTARQVNRCIKGRSANH